MPLGDHAQAEGTSDQHPIIIPGVKASEFRNLMKMIYCPLSDAFFVDIHSDRQSSTKAHRELVFCSDIARLSHRFGIPRFEKWAEGEIMHLLTRSAGNLNAYTLRQNDPITSILPTLAYAKLTLNKCLEYELQYCSILPVVLPPTSLLNLMDNLGRREEPALFGFWFMLLLNLGYKTWQDEAFTKKDRIALFLAQARLTPVLACLGRDLVFPLLTWPNPGHNGQLKALQGRICLDRCARKIRGVWFTLFDSEYYEVITSGVALTPTTMLCELPSIRSDFADDLRRLSTCKCKTEALSWLDEDIRQLFVRLAEYYQDIN
ncbi:The BTB (BR-C, ttk and bab)/POZ (Pox virus and Zinc finger) domain [Ceratobasidium sp. AG-Ba]|nr:The BTB (BR-C, ttk and bab)/POZ (Pox virus and Zinc finger) domain [Ceratobasidium sp. AG-Ba]